MCGVKHSNLKTVATVRSEYSALTIEAVGGYWALDKNPKAVATALNMLQDDVEVLYCMYNSGLNRLAAKDV